MPITGFPAINDTDLIRDGHIDTFLTQLHTDTKDIARLLNRQSDGRLPSGTTLILTRDDNGNVIEIRERRKLLPASKIKVEILFSKLLRGTGANPLTPGDSFGLPSFGVLSPIGTGIRQGGVTNIGTTEITFQINDTQTIINRKMKVTQEMLDTQEIEFDGYPLSFFGIVKEHVEEEEIVDPDTGLITIKKSRLGFNFTQEEIDKIGKFSSGVFEGGPRRSINGATSSIGQFGDVGVPEIKIEDILFSDQENLFEEIIRDVRKYKFRGDNPDASGERQFPYEAVNNQDDATDKKIKIKTTGLIGGINLQAGDAIYLTYNICIKRRIRQGVRHRGQGFQDTGVGVTGTIGLILTTSDVFDYQLESWYVPKKVPGSFNDPDVDFKTPIDIYIKGKSISNPDATKVLNNNNELLEGWRWSEVVSDRVSEYWTADYRGILYIKEDVAEVVLDAQNIRDQIWWNSYLDDLQAYGELRLSSFDARIDNWEDKFKDDKDEVSGWLMDISEPTNTLVFDREKLPYFRVFAQSLMTASIYDNQNENTGVGLVALDLLNWLKKKEGLDSWSQAIGIFPGSQFVKQTEFPPALVFPLLDLSVLFFNSVNAVPIPSINCEEDFMLFEFHYPVFPFDAVDGRGIWLSPSFVDNAFGEWRPPGGSFNTQWLLETPYYCGDFSRKTRVYTERIGGNSLETFSTIYVNVVPSAPSNISLDNSFYSDQSTVSFRDDLFNNSIVYSTFHDGFVEMDMQEVRQDRNITHEPIEFNHDESMLIGSNRILGDRPSFSNGIPITDELRQVILGTKIDFFQEADLLDSSTDGFLDFLQEIPVLTIPDEWKIKSIILEYDLLNEVIPEEDKFLSLKFIGSNIIINNLTFPIYGEDKIIFSIDAKLYSGGPVEFISGFWNHLIIEKARLVYTVDDLLDLKIDSGQTATVYDNNGRLLVFYADDVSGNISVALSVNEGDSWEIFTDILRLVSGETANLPFVIGSRDSNIVHLFWVLNDLFIMYKEINTDLFNNNDIGVEYVPSTSYESESSDDDSDNIESSLVNYSDEGKKLRRETSYFIAGNGTDPFFEEQLVITAGIKTKNEENQEGEDKFQSIRYDFLGSKVEMRQNYQGNAYSVYVDNGGLVRLFMLTNNKLTIKVGGDFFRWFIQAEDIVIHHNFVGDKALDETDLEVRNIQVARDPFDSAETVILYVHNGMLLMRSLQSDFLSIDKVEIEGVTAEEIIISNDNSDLVAHLEVSESSGNKPIFLVGNIPQGIKDNISDPNMAIIFLYDSEMIEKFDSNFAINTDTQVAAYVMREGLLRVFYKDNIGSLQSVLISGNTPSLEVQNKPIITTGQLTTVVT